MSGLLRIEGMIYGGSGVGVELVTAAGGDSGAELPDGPRMMAPFVLPGELVSVAGPGGAVEVLEPAADRVVVPGCRHFGVCGGCQYQHGTYGAQLRIKEGILRELLGRAGVMGLPRIEVHAGEPWGYRNRVRMRVEQVDGRLRVGYNSRVSGKGLPGGTASESEPAFVPIGECPIAAPVLWRGAEAFERVAERWLELGRRWIGTVAEVEFFATADESRMQMTLLVRGQGMRRASSREGEIGEGEFARFCEEMRAEMPELVGGGVMVLPPVRPGAGSRGVQRPRAGVAWGAAGLKYEAAGRSYWVSRGGFFQVNRFLLDELIGLVTGGREGALAWDLYAGVGLFSRALGERFREVVAVEAGEIAAADLAAGVRGTGVRAVKMTTVEFLRGAVLERERPGLVVMDPPRAGVGLEVCGLLGRVGAAEMVYVSCDPTTLARDLRVMVDSGYNLAELHLVDLFPQTFHMETVAVLRRPACG